MTLAKQETEIMDAPTQLTPSEIIAEAKTKAEVLMDIVQSRNLYEKIGGDEKIYITAPAWQLIGAMYGCEVHTDFAKVIQNDAGEDIGVEVKVSLIRQGREVGSATSRCGIDEFVCSRAKGSQKIRFAESAALTWAASKAIKLNYSFVAVLAGYQPTPAEEMPREERPTAQKAPTKTTAKTPPKKGAQCPIHDEPFFERTRSDGSKFYSHKYGTGWCNQDTLEAVRKGKTKQPTLDGEVIDVHTG